MNKSKLGEDKAGFTAPTQADIEVLDLLTIGFGPAGVSMAVALEEKGWISSDTPAGDAPNHRILFLEGAACCGWHEQLMFDDAQINHHHFFDLATPVNPRSRFTFANYLHTKGRLFDFGLTKAPPSRPEWNDYIRWVGHHFPQHVKFDHKVAQLLPCFDSSGRLIFVRVICENGAEFLTKQLILSNGSVPRLPDVFANTLPNRVFHASKYQREISRNRDAGFQGNIAVVGGGMSGGEIVHDLYTRFPKCTVVSIHRGQGFQLADLSAFSSTLYNPQQVDYFYRLPQTSKDRLLSKITSSNYGGLTDAWVQKIFNLIYLENIKGSGRLKLLPFAEIQKVRETGDQVTLEGTETYTGQLFELAVDCVVLATGYDTDPLAGLLGDLRDLISCDDAGRPIVTRDYAVNTGNNSDISVYLSGLCEFSHGISDSHSFNMLATRSRMILEIISEYLARASI